MFTRDDWANLIVNTALAVAVATAAVLLSSNLGDDTIKTGWFGIAAQVFTVLVVAFIVEARGVLRDLYRFKVEARRVPKRLRRNRERQRMIRRELYLPERAVDKVPVDDFHQEEEVELLDLIDRGITSSKQSTMSLAISAGSGVTVAMVALVLGSTSTPIFGYVMAMLAVTCLSLGRMIGSAWGAMAISDKFGSLALSADEIRIELDDLARYSRPAEARQPSPRSDQQP